MAKAKYIVLKKFCNGERQPGGKITDHRGKPGVCKIGAWFPDEEYTGKDGVINAKELARLLKERLIADSSKVGKRKTTVDDLADNQGLKVGKDIITPKSKADVIRDEEDETEEESEETEPPADGEESEETEENDEAEETEEEEETPPPAPKKRPSRAKKKG